MSLVETEVLRIVVVLRVESSSYILADVVGLWEQRWHHALSVLLQIKLYVGRLHDCTVWF